MTDTTHLGLPFIEGGQAQKHVTHNQALRILDAVIQIVVEDVTRTTPPGLPAEGQRHVVASGATGTWAGHAGAIATWQDGAWIYLTPKTGWCLWSIEDATIFIFEGSAWQPLAPLASDVGQLGVNTTASAPNLLSVKSNAALLAAITTADGGSGDARLQIAKAASGNTASVVFSNNYSGRAEFGLTGDDHFHLKVSSDGASWQDAFVIDKTTANVAFNGFTDAAATRRQLSGPVRTITGSDTIVASDIGKTLVFNGTSAFTMTITAAATLGNGFWCDIRNAGTALVTLDPNASETIDGKTTLTVGLAEAMRVVCNGTAFHTDASNGKLVELGRFTNPAAAQVDFDFAAGWPADFSGFEIHLIDVSPATDDVFLSMRIKTGALTVQTSGYAYMGRIQGLGGGADISSTMDSTFDRITLTRVGIGLGIGNDLGETVSGILSFSLPGSSNLKQARFLGSYARSDGVVQNVNTTGYYNSTSAWTGVRLFMSSGNILNGSIVLYGRRK